MLRTPSSECHDTLFKTTSVLGELVDDTTARRAALSTPAHEARFFEFLQPCGKDIARDFWEAALQVAEALRLHKQVANDEQRPPLTRNFKGTRKAAVLSVNPGRHGPILTLTCYFVYYLLFTSLCNTISRSDFEINVQVAGCQGLGGLDFQAYYEYPQCIYVILVCDEAELILKGTARKWGNSLAVRIPKIVSEDLGIEENAAISMLIDDGSLVITPVSGRKKRLQKALNRITHENLPDEKEPFGKSVGRERW